MRSIESLYIVIVVISVSQILQKNKKKIFKTTCKLSHKKNK